MSFTFNAEHMCQDLIALSRGASAFFVPQSSQRLEALARDLRNAIMQAKASGQPKFAWRTQVGSPLQIRGSKSWKGGTDDFGAMTADIGVDYACCYLPVSSRVQVEGVAVVTIRDVSGSGEKVVHFDVEEGGWHEMQNGQRADRAGHPPFHAQFHGLVNDIPRMPTLIVHPIDVINFAILELHQKHWRKHIATFEAKSQLRQFPLRQRARLVTILQSWTGVINNSDRHALVALQEPFAAPLAL